RVLAVPARLPLLVPRRLPPPALHTLALPDALPISGDRPDHGDAAGVLGVRRPRSAAVHDHPGGPALLRDVLLPDVRAAAGAQGGDRKSTRLHSSHVSISYAVFGLHTDTSSSRFSPS